MSSRVKELEKSFMKTFIYFSTLNTREFNFESIHMYIKR